MALEELLGALIAQALHEGGRVDEVREQDRGDCGAHGFAHGHQSTLYAGHCGGLPGHPREKDRAAEFTSCHSSSSIRCSSACTSLKASTSRTSGIGCRRTSCTVREAEALSRGLDAPRCLVAALTGDGPVRQVPLGHELEGPPQMLVQAPPSTSSRTSVARASILVQRQFAAGYEEFSDHGAPRAGRAAAADQFDAALEDP